MSVDISKIFKASVKAVRLNLPDTDDRNDLLNEELFGKSKSKLLKKTTSPDVNTSSIAKESRLIIKNITVLKEFLNDNKKEYIQPNYLLNQTNDNTNWQAYEDQAEEIIQKCAEATRTLKQKALLPKAMEMTDQYKDHLENMFYLLEQYLKNVCKIYTEQKAIRVKRIVERKNFYQINAKYLDSSKKKYGSPTFKNLDEEIEKEEESKKNTHLTSEFENQLTEQELMTLENENEELYDDLNSQMQEVRKIEGEVIEVSRLTQIFAENIVSQLTSIETIHKSAIETNSNLSLGNENIKEAMKKNAALRLWILFIIVVLSFTLLFLDWYNE